MNQQTPMPSPQSPRAFRRGARACVVPLAALLLAACGRAAPAAGPVEAPNLITNPGFEDGTTGWSVAFGGGSADVIRIDPEAHGGQAAAHLSARDGVVGIDNRTLVVGEDVSRRQVYELSAWIRNDGISRGGFGLRLYCRDADGGHVAMLGGIDVTTQTAQHGWRRYSCRFGRGTSQPLPAGTSALLVRFSIWDASQKARGDVWLDDVSMTAIAGETPAPTRAKPVVLLWDDPLMATRAGGGTESIREALHGVPCEVRSATTRELVKQDTLSLDTVDLVVLPYGGLYPAAAGAALVDFLQEGGAYCTLGGRAFTTPLVEVDGKWCELDATLPDATEIVLHRPWTGGHSADGDELIMAPAPEGQADGCARFHVDDLSLYGYAGTELPELAPRDTVLCFEARGDAGTPLLCLELTEDDGSRWKSVVSLGTAWREYCVHVSSFSAYATDSRGGEGDCYHPERGGKFMVGFTRKMVGPGSHVFHLRRLRLCRGVVPAERIGRLRLFPAAEHDPAEWFGKQVVSRTGLPDISVFREARRVRTDVLTLAAGQDSLGPGGVPAGGDWTGWSVTGWRAPRLRKEGKPPWYERLVSGGPAAPLPVLQLADAGTTVAAVLTHAAGPFAGSAWASFGLDARHAASYGEGPLRDALVYAIKACTQGVFIHRLRPVFAVRDGKVVMDATAFVQSMSPQGRETTLSVQLDYEGKTVLRQSRTVRLEPKQMTPVILLRGIPLADFGWQAFSLTARCPELGVTTATWELSLRQALAGIGDFLVAEGSDDGKYSGTSFVDNRGARGLLGAYEITGDARYLRSALGWGRAMLDEQREDGGYRMGYGIGPKGEACYVADGGEIAVGIARLVSYAKGDEREAFMESLRRYMGYRDSFRVPGGGIGVGWCLQDYGQRPIVPLDKPTRILAPERNTYTIGCTLAAAYAYAGLTASPVDEEGAERDADWLMARAKTLHGAFCESFVYAHAFATGEVRRRQYAGFLAENFTGPIVEDDKAWWLGGGGRSSLDLNGLAYALAHLEPSPELRAAIATAACAMFSPSSPEALQRLMAHEKLTTNEWIYICFGYLSLVDTIKPMVSMERFVP